MGACGECTQSEQSGSQDSLVFVGVWEARKGGECTRMYPNVPECTRMYPNVPSFFLRMYPAPIRHRGPRGTQNTPSPITLGTSRMPSGRHDKDLVFGMDGLLRFTVAGRAREPHGFFGATYGGVDRLQGATAFSVSQLVNQNLAAQERIPGCSDFASRPQVLRHRWAGCTGRTTPTKKAGA